MKHSYRDRWFADPFILDVNDSEIILLAEEVEDKMQQGVISKLVIDRASYVLKSKKTILELPTHLSFPVIMREGNKILVYPESGASGKLTMYECPDREATIFVLQDDNENISAWDVCKDREATISVLQDDNENILAWDVCNHPMYSAEDCVETVFSGEDDLISELNNSLENNGLDQFIEIANQHNIQCKNAVIDETIYNALLEYLDKKN